MFYIMILLKWKKVLYNTSICKRFKLTRIEANKKVRFNTVKRLKLISTIKALTYDS